MDIPFMTVAELGRAYDRRELSPVEVTRALLDRIARHDGKFDSFIRVTERVALAEAKIAEAELMAGRRRGPIHGRPRGFRPPATQRIPRSLGYADEPAHVFRPDRLP